MPALLILLMGSTNLIRKLINGALCKDLIVVANKLVVAAECFDVHRIILR